MHAITITYLVADAHAQRRQRMASDGPVTTQSCGEVHWLCRGNAHMQPSTAGLQHLRPNALLAAGVGVRRVCSSRDTTGHQPAGGGLNDTAAPATHRHKGRGRGKRRGAMDQNHHHQPPAPVAPAHPLRLQVHDWFESRREPRQHALTVGARSSQRRVGAAAGARSGSGAGETPRAGSTLSPPPASARGPATPVR